ncbi:unnamed protein product [Darwinula stevensoni]|uniref:Ion transport domain-containing protein n=1 Tax=Darwinula stevensoni TaxID=69355 RepID=A0A7R8X9V0_9CRUS|nr:unnamed protein product [Darwinula stevensoni]CAG0884772.1 unnamed protein product [Darwinula stevensoni]
MAQVKAEGRERKKGSFPKKHPFLWKSMEMDERTEGESPGEDENGQDNEAFSDQPFPSPAQQNNRNHHMPHPQQQQHPKRGRRMQRREEQTINRHRKLSRAIRLKDGDTVRALVMEYTNVEGDNGKYNLGAALFVAVKTGDLSCVRPILDKVSDIRYADSDGNTALHVACAQGSADIVEKLLEKKVDVSRENKQKMRPLTLATQGSHTDVVRAILTHRVPKPEDIDDALTLAAAKGHCQIVKVLMESGFGTSKGINSAMVNTAEHGHPECLELLLAHPGIDLNFRSNQKTALHKCILRSGDMRCLQLLLDRGADPNVQDSLGATPTYYMVFRDGERNDEGLELLIKHHADVDIGIKDKDLKPLHAAAGLQDPRCLQILLDQYGDDGVNAKTSEGRNCLHCAAMEGRVENVRVILSEPLFRIDDKDEKGNTALHLAAYEGHADIVKELLAKSAIWTEANVDGNTPIHLAAQSTDLEVLRLLFDRARNSGAAEAVNHGIDFTDQGAEEYHDPSSGSGIIQALLRAANNEGETPVHLAAKSGGGDAVHFLVEHGGSITTRDASGRTPMSIMIQKTPGIITRLLDRGIQSRNDPDSKLLEVHFDFSIFRVEEDANQESHTHFWDFGRPASKASSVARTLRTDTDNVKEFVDGGRSDFLDHPLCLIFTMMKWYRYRRIWLLQLVLYVLFVLSLTSYECIFYGYLTYEALGNGSGLKCELNDTEFDEKSVACTFYDVSLVFLYIFTILILIQEIMQIGFIKARYFLQWENYLQLGLMVLVILTSPYPSASESYHVFQHHLSAIIVLFAWIQLMIIIGRSPVLGIYITLFRKMAKIFIKFILIYIWVIVGSSLSFFILFRGASGFDNDYNPFDNPLKSFAKSMIMLTGEFDYVSSFSAEILYPYTTHILYLAFVLLVSLILGNLLVALAVNDLNKIQKEADVKKVANMLELISYIEYLIPYKRLLFLPTEQDPEFVKMLPNDPETHTKVFIRFRSRFRLPTMSSEKAMTVDPETRTKIQGIVKARRKKQERRISRGYLYPHESVRLKRLSFVTGPTPDQDGAKRNSRYVSQLNPIAEDQPDGATTRASFSTGAVDVDRRLNALELGMERCLARLDELLRISYTKNWGSIESLSSSIA